MTTPRSDGNARGRFTGQAPPGGAVAVKTVDAEGADTSEAVWWWWLRVVFGTVAAAAVMFAYCNAPSTTLQLMRADPVISNPPAFVEEVSRQETDGDIAGPELLVVYRTVPEATRGEAIRHILDVAQASGWSRTGSTSRMVQFHKQLVNADDPGIFLKVYVDDPETGRDIGVVQFVYRWR